MATISALQEQLKKLRAPQTNLLQDVKRRPSFMFDPDKAATITRATFYEIGKNGLDELIALDERFEKFANSLFDESALYLQRTVETKKKNEEIDELIKEFLYYLIPYFQLRPAHCVLEWLIVRFNVHLFNVDDLLFFLLPYYHTKLFARALQVVDIKSHASRWSWLFKVRKEAIPLARTILFTRCATDAFLLKMICRKTEEAVRIAPCQILINFYTSCLVGVIQMAAPLQDIHISHMLPSLTSALASDQRAFVLSGFVVLNFIMSKTQLEMKVVGSLVKKMLEVNVSVYEQKTLLLLSVFQKFPTLHLPSSSFEHLVRRDWFIKCLMRISADPDAYDTLPLCYGVVKRCIEYVKEGGNEEDEDMLKKVKLLGMNIFLNIKFEDEEVLSLLEMVKDSVVSDMPGLVEYTSRLVQLVESQYPNAWDAFIYKYTSVDKDSTLSEVQRKVLTLKIEQTSHAEVYMKLTNSKALLRAETVKYLAAHATPGDIRESIRHVIRNLWSDDEPCVVEALLDLPEWLWCLEVQDLVNTLIHVHQQAVTNQKWEETAYRAVRKFLDSEVCTTEGEDRDRILLALLPHLLNEKCLQEVLRSRFAQTDGFLRQVKKDGNTVYDALLKGTSGLPSTLHVLSILSKMPQFRKPVYVTFTCLILSANILQVKDQDELFKLFRFVSQFFEGEKIDCKSTLSMNTLQRVGQKGKVPLCVYDHFMGALISKLDLGSEQSMWKYCKNTQLVQMFCTLVSKCNELEKNGQTKQLDSHVRIVKCFIEKCLPTVDEQVKFYCNIGLNSDVNLSIWCLYMLGVLAKKSQVTLDASCVTYLMILLYSNNEVVRKLCLDLLQCMANTFQGVLGGKKDKAFKEFVKELIKYREEIYLDNQSTVTYVGQILGNFSPVLDALLDSVLLEETPSHITLQLLQILADVNSCYIFKKLSPLALRIIAKAEDTKVIEEPESHIVRLILTRFSHNTAEVLDDASCWHCIQTCARNITVKLALSGDSLLCANVVFDNVNAEVYDSLSSVGKERILALLLEMKHATENDAIHTCVKEFVKKISLDSSLIETFLKDMASAELQTQVATRRRRVVEAPTVDLLNTKEWKLGVATLESIEHKKKLDNSQLLLPHIFQVLKKCLQFDEQMCVEYIKQLCLASLHNCLLRVEESLPGNVLDIDAVVESIRTSKNPQTHHQALLLLAHIASIQPDQVLKKFMPIFTFMGDSILRLDDAYSLQIINKVIENVVPVILTTGSSNDDVTEANVIQVLRVFTDAIMDIPDHRRIYLMEKLLNTLDNGHYLYIFLELMFERHVLYPEPIQDMNMVKRFNKDMKQSTGMPKRLKLALHVCSKYPLNILLESCHKLVQFLQLIPQEKDDRFSSEDGRKKVQRIIRVDKITPKQFRHYKYTLLMFTSSLLSSHSTVALITKNNEYEDRHVSKLNLDEVLKSTIEEILKYTQLVTKQVDMNSQNKYWAGMLSQCYDILDKINALIDSTVFVNVIKKLLKHNTQSLRKRCLDMLNWRLQQKHVFQVGDLLKLVTPLVNLAVNSEGVNSVEAQVNQQTALLSLKLFVRNIGDDQSKLFIDILKQLMTVLEKQHEPPVTASLIICIAEMCAMLKVYALTVLPVFMPALVSSLQTFKTCDVNTLAVISSLLKVVEHLSMFMSPYLVDILAEVCVLDTTDWTDAGKGVAIRTKLGYLKTKISHDIPARVLVTSVASCFTRLITAESYPAVTTLLGILGESFSTPGFLYKSDVTDFFISALDFRVKHASLSEETIVAVETSVVSALVKLILKLSESNFKPLFNKLYDWAFRASSGDPVCQHRVITFFILTSHIAEALKSLFVLFAGTIVKDCAVILDKTQVGKHTELYLPDADKNATLLDAVLSTLLSIFTHDVHQFMTKERFQLLMQHLVDQLENKLPQHETRCRRLVQPCIVQFAVSSSDDVQWKNINYEILLKTRDNDSYVRLMSLECILLLASKLGDNFLPLLPETVPFLAELLEDENEAVEKACHRVVQEMEQLLGEPISKYF